MSPEERPLPPEMIPEPWRQAGFMPPWPPPKPPLRADALTIGFARRFATYKRATLIFRDVQRLKALMLDEVRPVQLIVAGKAHPRDGAGKDFIRQMHDMARREGLTDHIVCRVAGRIRRMHALSLMYVLREAEGLALRYLSAEE